VIGFEPTIAAGGGPSGCAASGFFGPAATRKAFEDAVDQIAEAISRPSVRPAIKLQSGRAR
jgi:hypothetical protein